MKAMVIYKSKTGFTKKYSEWISEELSADIFDISDVTTNMLTAYDSVIYGGGLYAAGINGVKFITQNLDKLKDKKVVVFATGVSPLRDDLVREVKDKNFNSEQQKVIRFFYLRGGFDYRKLNLLDKMLMTLLKTSIKWKKKKKKKLTSDEIGMLEIYDKPTDYTRKNKISELIAYVR